jgi:predicted MFS family arabinose efflux permease
MSETPGPDHDRAARGQSVRILTLISSGHALSNFYALCLPPLIPFLKAEFGVSYAALGLVMSIRSFSAGILQVPMGILVDSLGAKRVLLGGLLTMTVGFGVVGAAPSYAWLVVGAVLLGFGMSTLRPANYKILNASIEPAWMGRAYGVNMFSAHTGRAIAPAITIALAAMLSWRLAVAAITVTGLVIVAGLVSQWRIVRDDTLPVRDGKETRIIEELRLLASRTIALFFIFYLLSALATNGLHSFTVVALVQLQNTPIEVASGALTGFLAAGAIGVLAGGFIVDKTPRHAMVAAIALLLSTALLLIFTRVSMTAVVIVALMSLVGFLQGMIRPARDMMVRAVLPTESFGKAIGMIGTGAAIGGSLGPVAFGWVMDIGEPQWLIYVVGICFILTMVIILMPMDKVVARR